MRRKLFLLIILLGVCFLFIKKDEEEIRIRVISHSESPIDIYYKEDVVEYLKTKVLVKEKIDDEYFRLNYKKIENELNEKFDNITVKYENHLFTNKLTEEAVLENKEYKTLLVIIGDGQGPNWWGSVFDEVLYDGGSSEIKYEWFFNR